ncbi:diphthamide synthesis protein [Candidatus Woesearchaeota archaeon]|nr:diphthamide synthesis protein [Candidatus Woesearchaeota archaeon]
MDAFFIPAKAEEKVSIPQKHITELPERVCLASSVQFIDSLPPIKAQLENAGKKASLVKAKHAEFEGQMLGCGWEGLQYDKDAEAFLYIGDGDFHPKALLLASDKDVYAFNPFSRSFRKMDEKFRADMNRKRNAGLVKFLHSENIGVLLSTKPGQMRLKEALSLKGRFPEKKFYYLVANTVDFNELENFNFVECFVNTACNRLLDDYSKFSKPIVNIADLPK